MKSGAEKDKILASLINLVKVALTNVSMGYNESRETVIKHCIDFMKHTKKSPLQKADLEEFEMLISELQIVKDQ
jgi:hypothetical protein